MSHRLFSGRRTPRHLPLLAGWWNEWRFFWHTWNKGPWIVVLSLGAIAAAVAGLVWLVDTNRAEQRELACLALNVYYEARGEPLAGMYAVAEVTMNRVNSRRYPPTVCGVVYEQKWDWLRKRRVGAFSWTEFDIVPHPEGSQWKQARMVAEAVYHGKQPPVLDGATHYHATYIRPSWARREEQVARIGSHIFYRQP
jgi:spore germination cell wall hydrolase CwlJ-like protein